MPAPRIETAPVLEYEANGQKTIKIDRGFVLREIPLTLTATVAVAALGDTTSRANIFAAGIWGLVRQLRLKLNSNTNIREIDGNTLMLLNRFYYGSGDLDQFNIIGIAADGSAVVESTMILPLWMVNSRRPIDTQHDATLLSNLELTVNWGTAADVGSGTGLEVSNVSMNVGTLNAVGVKGPFNQQLLTQRIEANVATNTKFQIDLPVGNLYRSFLIGQMDANAQNDESTNRIANIKLKSGGTNYVDIDAVQYRRWQRKKLGIYQSLDVGAGATNPEFTSAGRVIDNWYYVDLVTDGMLSETLNTTSFSELKLELEIVNGPIPTLVVVPQEIIPLRNGS